MTDPTAKPPSLYERIVAAGCEIDSYGSDLHVLATPQAREVVRDYEENGGESNRSSFRDEEGRLWLVLAHHCVPYWTDGNDVSNTPVGSA